MSRKKHFIFLMLYLLSHSFSSMGQTIIWEPGLSYTWTSGPRWNYNIQLETRNKLYEESATFDFQFYDLEFYGTRKFFNENSFTAGYLHRHKAPYDDEQYNYEHRFMQQLTLISFLVDNRIAHRIRLEQRIKSEEYENRIRYRLSYDFPLQGQSLNSGEKYLVISNELLSTFNAQNISFSNRTYLGLGWYINSKRKFENGVEARFEDIDESKRFLIFLTSKFFINR